MRRAIFVLSALLALGACSPGNIGPFIGTAGSSGGFTFTSNGSPVSTISITGAGSLSTVVVSEAGYSGTFTASSSDTAVATVAAAGTSAVRRDSSSSASGESFTITAVGGGTATITFTDSNGHSSSVSVGVTTTTGVIYTPNR
jgi:hypothetical protein